MRISVPHSWPADEHEALQIQNQLRPLVNQDTGPPTQPETIAGMDVAYATESDRVAAAVVVLDARTSTVVDQATATGTVAFPYIPGLLAFRELPTLVHALEQLSVTPDLVMCDGYGIAHPRRFGLACHIGVLTGLPSIGVGKTAFVGTFDPPGRNRGDSAPLQFEGEHVGRALRTQTGIKPVFVSVGHRIDLDTACQRVLAAAPRYRLPETTRVADRLARDVLAADTSTPT
ncbi:deoxyribonuclease V [Nocardia sp. CNY236]|uniref:deoxyribonuclease V n=1 Tax=Nocardia sp. CNY236 TaxID=1169152 RepID=UPI000429CCF9|nr:deoxyribonuclease V [Nocardia sp. CNY236]